MFSWIIFITISVLVVAFLSGRFTAECAAEKGRSKRAWFFWGAPFRSFLFRGWSWGSCQKSKAASVGGLFHFLLALRTSGEVGFHAAVRGIVDIKRPQ